MVPKTEQGTEPEHRNTTMNDNETSSQLQEAIDLIKKLVKKNRNDLKQLVEKTMNEANDTKNSDMNMLKDFLSLNPPTFKPSTWGAIAEAETWLRETEKIFKIMSCTDEQKLMLATYTMKGQADCWWDMVNTNRSSCSWAQFKELFYERYINPYVLEQIQKFMELKQGYSSVHEYETKFLEIRRFVSYHLPGDFDYAYKFEFGLKYEIWKEVRSSNKRTYAEIVNQALAVESKNRNKKH